MTYNLDRFVQAQDSGAYTRAIAELQAGAKRSHWIWFIFPQIAGLGSSPMAETYGLHGVAEAAGVRFSGLWLAAPAAAMEERLRARRGDASDASPAVLARQLRQDPGPLDWVRIDAGAGPGECLAAAQRALSLG